MKKVLLILLGIALTIVLILSSLVYLAFNTIRTEKDTILFQLLIASVIKEVPIIDSVESPQYSTSPGDGLALPRDEVYYRSTASSEKILEITESYIKNKGFTYKEDSDITNHFNGITRIYEKQGSVISIKVGNIEDDNKNRLVIVSEIY